jgi:hypothetical protein
MPNEAMTASPIGAIASANAAIQGRTHAPVF